MEGYNLLKRQITHLRKWCYWLGIWIFVVHLFGGLGYWYQDYKAITLEKRIEVLEIALTYHVKLICHED